MARDSGTHSLVFDNSFSLLASKSVRLTYRVVPPKRPVMQVPETLPAFAAAPQGVLHFPQMSFAYLQPGLHARQYSCQCGDGRWRG